MRVPIDPTSSALVDALSRATPGENIPLMLELARRYAARRTPSDLLEQQARDSFVTPSMLDPRLVLRLDAIALEAASEFEAVLLSPLAPLGACSVVSPTTQDRALSTVRGTEVVSDPTNVLALLCAARLKKKPRDPVRLCTNHQVVRPQRFDARPGRSQHFRLFCAAEAGPARPEHELEVAAFVGHASMFMRMFDAAEQALGCSFPDRKATLFVRPDREPIASRVRDRVRALLPTLELREEPFASEYYDGLRLLVGAANREGEHVPLGDIGLFDWAAKLTSNRRARLVASGIGTQLFPLVFRSG